RTRGRDPSARRAIKSIACAIAEALTAGTGDKSAVPFWRATDAQARQATGRARRLRAVLRSAYAPPRDGDERAAATPQAPRAIPPLAFLRIHPPPAPCGAA